MFVFIDSVVARFTVVAQDHLRPCLPRCRCESLEHATTGDHIIAVTADFQACIEDGTVSQMVRGNSSIDTNLIRDKCGSEVLFEICVAMKFVDDDDDDNDDDHSEVITKLINISQAFRVNKISAHTNMYNNFYLLCEY